jgi:small subunit ribosomal protein S20
VTAAGPHGSGERFRISTVQEEVFPVANIKQQKKRVLTNEIARRRNQAVRSRLHTETRKFHALVEAGDVEGAEKQLRVATRLFDKAATKKVIHKNNAANKKSGLAATFNKLVAK